MDRAELAALCGVDERTVYRWETGESRIPDPQKALLSDLFGVSVDHLLGRDRGEPDGGSGHNGEKGAA